MNAMRDEGSKTGSFVGVSYVLAPGGLYKPYMVPEKYPLIPTLTPGMSYLPMSILLSSGFRAAGTVDMPAASICCSSDFWFVDILVVKTGC